MAGALDLLVAGPREYQGEVVRDPWIGEGRARAPPIDIRRALYIFWVACLIDGLAVAALTLWRYS
jgi:adenosylcobinamide-phosphate synthase